MLTQARPELFLYNMSKAKREGKIFVDYLRNGETASAVAAFSAGELSRMRSTDTAVLDGAFVPASTPAGSATLAESSARVRAEREPVSLLPAMRERDNSPDPSLPAPVWQRRPALLYGGGAALAMLLLLLWLGTRREDPKGPPRAAAITPAQTSTAVPPSGVPPLAAAAAPVPPPTAASGTPLAAEPSAPPEPSEVPAVPDPAAAPPAPRRIAVAPAPSKAARAKAARAEASAAREVAKPSEPALPPPAANITTTPDGPTATELGRAAQRELIQGHLAAAADLYSQATKVDPRNEPAWRGLGLANERLGRKAEAAKALQRALDLNPNGPNAGMLRARLEKLRQ